MTERFRPGTAGGSGIPVLAGRAPCGRLVDSTFPLVIRQSKAKARHQPTELAGCTKLWFHLLYTPGRFSAAVFCSVAQDNFSDPVPCSARATARTQGSPRELCTRWPRTLRLVGV